jgi:periplasmic glucans biosynthesis protein
MQECTIAVIVSPLVPPYQKGTSGGAWARRQTRGCPSSRAKLPRRYSLGPCVLLVASLCVASSGLAASPLTPTPTAVLRTPVEFSLDTLAARAQELASRSFEDASGRVPDWLLGLTYDQWRNIRFRPERSLWRKQPLAFELEFFHPGFLYNRTIIVNVVDATGVHPVPFSPDMFDYGNNDFVARVPADLGFAGFRLHYLLNRRDYKDELIVFLGASYFRAVGKGLGFGMSARGLAIDTALSSGEEFPFFREFWVVRPAADEKKVVIYAILDSPRAAGAYQFDVLPGDETIVAVDSRVFLRKPVAKLGVAPMTTMSYLGENSTRAVEDYRPEVHDSDGLLMASDGGEWIWRPLRNPRRLQMSTFQIGQPKGFGLVQRDREFDHYQDLETRREARPSVWIEPREGFDRGHVELVEIPTHSDANDNIVAYWVAEQRPEPGKPLTLSYKMHWHLTEDCRPPAGRVVATREGQGVGDNVRLLVVDFAGGRLPQLPAETVLRGVLTLGTGEDGQAELIEQHVLKNTVTGGWRLAFQVRPKRSEPLEMRAFLQLGKDALTETWSYVIEP